MRVLDAGTVPLHGGTRQTVSDILILHNTGEGELVFGSAPASILPQAEDVMLPESTEDEYAWTPAVYPSPRG